MIGGTNGRHSAYHPKRCHFETSPRYAKAHNVNSSGLYAVLHVFFLSVTRWEVLDLQSSVSGGDFPIFVKDQEKEKVTCILGVFFIRVDNDGNPTVRRLNAGYVPRNAASNFVSCPVSLREFGQLNGAAVWGSSVLLKRAVAGGVRHKRLAINGRICRSP